MSFEEKQNWINLVVNLTSPIVYSLILLNRAQAIPLAEVPYIATMLWVIGISVGVMILGAILTAIFSPREHDRKDERDIAINRYGETIGHAIFAIGTMGVLAMAMAEYAHFWIANGIYLSCAISTSVSNSMKLIAYRKGFRQW